jgi:predicted membrane-bound mannosyltransferase
LVLWEVEWWWATALAGSVPIWTVLVVQFYWLRWRVALQQRLQVFGETLW